MQRRTVIAAGQISTVGLAHAQLTSTRVARIVVPLGTGNQFDTSARVLADALSKVSGHTFIGDNKPGVGGCITTMEVALSTGFVLCVRSDAPYRSAQDLLSAARANPGKLSFGSFGIGNTTHVVGAHFPKGAGVELLHVPYKSPISDFLGGHVDSVFIGESIARGLIKDGRIHPLAISAAKRSPTLPDVPTFEELGLKDADVPAWSAIFGPRGMTVDQTQQLFRHVQQAAKMPEYQANAKLTGSEVVLMPLEKFVSYLESEYRRMQQVLPPLGIKRKYPPGSELSFVQSSKNAAAAARLRYINT